MKRIGPAAAVLQEHFGTVAADSGLRSTFREEHKYDQSGNGFSREDVMDDEWHMRMRKHARVERVLARLDADDRATLYHAFSTERWPEPLQTVFWYGAVNGCIAGVVMALPHTIAAAESSKSKSPGAWLRKAIRGQYMKAPLLFLLKQAERQTRYSLEAFQEAWDQDQP